MKVSSSLYGCMGSRLKGFRAAGYAGVTYSVEGLPFAAPLLAWTQRMCMWGVVGRCCSLQRNIDPVACLMLFWCRVSCVD